MVKNMTVKRAYNDARTKFVLVTRNGEILSINEKVVGNYNENEPVKKIDIINNISDGTPVVTAIRI